MNLESKIDIDNLKKNIYFINQFNKIYPEFNLELIDNELLIDIILTMYKKNLLILPNDKSNDKELNNMINELELFGKKTNTEKKNKIILNRIIAYEKIPELLVPDNVIIVIGKINENPINILFDTGASGCCMTIDAIYKCGLTDLIDYDYFVDVQGATEKKNSKGKIWYLELDLQCIDTKLKKYPISCEVINTINGQIDIVLGNNFLRKYNCEINFCSRTIILENYKINNDDTINVKEKNIISFK